MYSEQSRPEPLVARLEERPQAEAHLRGKYAEASVRFYATPLGTLALLSANGLPTSGEAVLSGEEGVSLLKLPSFRGFLWGAALISRFPPEGYAGKMLTLTLDGEPLAEGKAEVTEWCIPAEETPSREVEKQYQASLKGEEPPPEASAPETPSAPKEKPPAPREEPAGWGYYSGFFEE